MHIAAVASAFPDHYYTQQQILDELASYWSEQSDRLPALNRFHHRVGVDGRYLALPITEYKAMARWGQANDVWLQVAEDLGSKAICGALKQAGLPKEAIAALISVSVTGIASPSLDAHLVNFMGLPTNIRRVPIFGLGCVAGAAGLAQAAEYVRAYPDRMAVLLSVELCSLTWQREDLSIANLIASGLFGDGAAAVLVTGSDFDHDGHAPAGPEILGSQSSFYPDTEDTMGWDISEKGLSDCPVVECAAGDQGKSAARCGRLSREAWPDTRRYWQLGAAYRWAEDPGSDGCCSRASAGGLPGFVGLPAAGWQSFVDIGVARPGRRDAEPPAGAWNVRDPRGHGPRLLLRTRPPPLVTSRHGRALPSVAYASVGRTSSRQGNAYGAL